LKTAKKVTKAKVDQTGKITITSFFLKVISKGSSSTTSVATAQADIFAILGNKIVKNLKIFVEVDYLRSRGVLCQP